MNILAVMSYMPQDFRGTIIRQQRERSERNRQAEVDNLVNSGGTIRDRYSLLWNQQMERCGFYFLILNGICVVFWNFAFSRHKYLFLVFNVRRRQLAQLGSASGVFKALVKYLVGVPQVFFCF